MPIFDFLSLQRRIMISQGDPLTKEETALQHTYETSQSFLENLMFGLVFLSSEKGQEIYDRVEPVILKMLDMLEKSLCSMFQASAAQPILAIPATILFTNVANRLYLLDDLSGKVAIASVTGINMALAIEDIIAKAIGILTLTGSNLNKGTTTLVYSLPTGGRVEETRRVQPIGLVAPK